MLLSVVPDQAHQDRPRGLPATDIGAEIGHIAWAGRQDLIAASAHFPELAEFLESVHHAVDRGCSACLCSDAAPTFTQAAVRFVVSFAALIGLSLLLAGL